MFRQISHDLCKVVAWQSVNDKQTIAFQSHRTAQQDSHPMCPPPTPCPSTTNIHAHTLYLCFICFFCLSFGYRVLPLLFSFPTSTRLSLFRYTPPQLFFSSGRIFLFDRDVIEDVCLTAVSTESATPAVYLVCVCVSTL